MSGSGNNGQCFSTQFLALSEATGLSDGTDGILGLSAKSHGSEMKKFNILRKMKENKVIDKTMVSFSINFLGD